MVQTPETATGSQHCPRGRDAKAGHDYLAHAEQEEDLCRVPSTRGCLSENRRQEGRPRRSMLGLRPRPRDLSPWCQSRMEEGGIVPPHSVLAPGTALGLLPSRALSSAQVQDIVVVRR